MTLPLLIMIANANAYNSEFIVDLHTTGYLSLMIFSGVNENLTCKLVQPQEKLSQGTLFRC